MIKRFWFEFFRSQEKPLPMGVQHGCGLSAYNHDDAVELLKQKVFEGTELPTIENMVEDVDVSTLDNGHVLPNMGDVTIRGIWFPLGY
jgi:hypothetical protein